MKDIWLLFFIILLLSPLNSYAKVIKFTRDWAVNQTEWYVAAVTINDNKSILMQTCFYEIDKCDYSLVLNLPCEYQRKYKTLISSDKNSTSIELKGGNPIGDSGYYRYHFNYEDINNIVLSTKKISLAISIGSDNLRVEKFSLDGAVEAIKYMMKVFDSIKKGNIFEKSNGLE